MNTTAWRRAHGYGGSHTVRKLAIVEEYLKIYTTAMKNQPQWKLVYVDPFAGAGWIGEPNQSAEERAFLRGSAERALAIRDRCFDQLVFSDLNPDRSDALHQLRAAHPDRDIRVFTAEANTFLQGFERDWRRWRGVLFLDPFGAQVEWNTIERVAGFEALDRWILFLTSAIQRMLPSSGRPDDIAEGWVARLNLVYGSDAWRRLYQPSEQLSLFGPPAERRQRGAEGLLRVYQEQMRKAFGARAVKKSAPLCDSRGRPLFNLLFLVGNPAGIPVARRIARHTMTSI